MDKKIIVLMGLVVLLYFFTKPAEDIDTSDLISASLINDIYDPEGTIDFSPLAITSDLTFVEKGTRVQCPENAEYCKAKLYKSRYGTTKYIYTYTLKPKQWKIANAPYYVEVYAKYPLATTISAITTTQPIRLTTLSTPTFGKGKCGYIVEENCQGDNCINFVFVYLRAYGSYYYQDEYFKEQRNNIINSASAFSTHRNKINFYAIYDGSINYLNLDRRSDPDNPKGGWGGRLKDIENFVLDSYSDCDYYKLIGIIKDPGFGGFSSVAWLDGSVTLCVTPTERSFHYTCIHELGHTFGLVHPWDCGIRYQNKLPVCENGKRTYEECDAMCCVACKWCPKDEFNMNIIDDYHFVQISDDWISQKLSESLS